MSKKALEVFVRQDWKGKGKTINFQFRAFVMDQL